MQGAFFEFGKVSYMHTNPRPAYSYIERRGAVSTPLRVIEVNASQPRGRQNRSGKDRKAERYFYYTATASHDIVLSFDGWRWEGTHYENNVGNNYDVLLCSVEAPNGNVAPVYFSGVRNKTIVDGDANIMSDALPASALGYSTLPVGIYKVKLIAGFAAGGYTPERGAFQGDVAGQQNQWYTAADTTPSDIDVAGAFTYSGVPPDASWPAGGIRPIMLGHPVVDGKSFIGVGDSIFFSVNSGGTGIAGRGPLNMPAYNGGVDSYPCMNFSLSGSRTWIAQERTKWRSYLPYARFGFDEFGTNDLDAVDAAFTQGRQTQLWDIMYDGGLEKVYRTELLPYCSTTDSFATEANQTVQATWTGRANTMNAFYISSTGTLIDGVASMAGLKGTDTSKWKVDGTANKYVQDGRHPTFFGEGVMAASIRAVMESV